MLTSRDNPRVKTVKALQRREKRDRTGLYLVEGVKLVGEALKWAPNFVEEVFWAPEILAGNEAGLALVEELKTRGIPVTAVSAALMREMAATVTPQGILAVMRRGEEERVTEVLSRGGNEPFVLVVDRVQDPGNLGTLLRTAEAAGVGAVLLVKGTVDLYNPKVLRAAAGAVFRLPVQGGLEAADVLALAERYRLPLLVADPRGEETVYDPFPLRAMLVVGNEGRGVDHCFTACARRLAIPLAEGAESLNVAIAAAVFLFERVRRLREGERGKS